MPVILPMKLIEINVSEIELNWIKDIFPRLFSFLAIERELMATEIGSAMNISL